MNTLSFESGKAFIINEVKEDKIAISTISSCLNCPVLIDDKTTFWDLWQYLEQDAEYFSLVFAEAMGGVNINEYREQIRKTGRTKEEEDPENHIDYLRCYWHAEIWESELDVYPAFDGIGPAKDQDMDGVEGDAWAIDFTPINNLKHYPIKLDTKLSIYNVDEESLEPTITTTKRWTLYDVLYCILSEISFCGNPRDQIKRISELDQAIAEVKEMYKDYLPGKENEDIDS